MASTLFGIVALFDSFTLVIGVPAGFVAIVLAGLGMRDLRNRPQMLGRLLCRVGITLGGLGILATAAFQLFLYPWLSSYR